MIKKTVLTASLFASILMFWGCPYKSLVPLNKPVELLMPELIGSWVPENDVNLEQPDYYTIEKFDSTQYAIEHFQYSKDDKEYSIKNYVGHSTHIDGVLFMNLVESGKKEYLLHRVQLIPDGLILYQVTGNIDEKFETSAEMQKFFQQHMKLSFFYNQDEIRLVRK